MEISSSSHAAMSRTVTPAKSSSDRQSNEEKQDVVAQTKVQERMHEQRKVQDGLQQRNEENQRRLDGRLISFGRTEDSASDEKQTSFNRSRVNDAYSPPNNERSNAQQQTEAQQPKEAEAIDIVV